MHRTSAANTYHYPDALDEFVQGVHYLNHDCKFQGYDFKRVRCRNKNDVYAKFKNPSVEWLYKRGYCIYAEEEIHSIPCRDCNGNGRDTYTNMPCYKCKGGVFRVDALIGFHFIVHDTRYSFHVPQKHVRFAFTLDKPKAISAQPFVPLSFTPEQAATVVSRFLKEKAHSYIDPLPKSRTLVTYFFRGVAA